VSCMDLRGWKGADERQNYTSLLLDEPGTACFDGQGGYEQREWSGPVSLWDLEETYWWRFGSST
jgi:hypothetical protein